MLASARANADQRRYAQAYDEYTRATQLSPDHYLTWAGRGALLASVGAWESAASDYAKAIQLGTPAADASWWGVPQLCYYAGEHKAYEAVCASLEEKLFDSEDTAMVTIAARSICLQPIAKEHARRIAAKLEQALDRPQDLPPFGFPRDDPPPPPPPLGDFGGSPPPNGFPRELLAYAAALAHYRCEDFDRARALLEPIAANSVRFRPTAQLAQPLLAMTCERLGQSERAKSCSSSQATESIQSWAEGSEDAQASPLPWFDGIESQILLSEATQLITSQSLDDSVFEQVDADALRLLQP